MLGVHAGMSYFNSRTAIGVSLGTIFFLFLGIATCIRIMIAFSGDFNLQLQPFIAFMLGGGTGLYVALAQGILRGQLAWRRCCAPLPRFMRSPAFGWAILWVRSWSLQEFTGSRRRPCLFRQFLNSTSPRDEPRPGIERKKPRNLGPWALNILRF